MYFLIESNDLRGKYNAIWDKGSFDTKKEFDKESVYNKEHLNTKIKSHGDEVSSLHVKDNPPIDSNHTYLVVTSLDFVLKKMKVIIHKCF